jgi:amidophosphoribosyltransferase
VFNNQDIFADLPGMMASGHVRYSTTGGSGLRNIQPLFADLADGGSPSRITATSPTP